MIDRDNNRLFIVQGEYGIIAPDLDINGITELASTQFSVCLALAASDKIRKIGLLAHIVIPGCSLNVAEEGPAALKELGARELTIQTANIGKQLFHKLVMDSQTLVDLFANNARELGIAVTQEPDIGSTYAVSFNPVHGLSIQQRKLFQRHEPALGIRGDIRYREIIGSIASSQKPELKCVYRPNLVLPPA